MNQMVRQAVRQALRDYFKTPEGEAVLDQAPRIPNSERGDTRRISIREALEALIEELEAMR